MLECANYHENYSNNISEGMHVSVSYSCTHYVYTSYIASSKIGLKTTPKPSVK